jgi:hypothetical protein
MKAEFKQILDSVKDVSVDEEWQKHTQALKGKRSRVVPIATTELYNMIAPAQKRQPLQTWRDWVDSDESNWLVNQAKGQTGATSDFIRRVMCSPGTYNALLRGEVPYYSRDLSSSIMYDEENNVIDATGFPKIGKAIDTEMNERRQELQRNGNDAEEVYTIFAAQILTKISEINDDLQKSIARHEAP